MTVDIEGYLSSKSLTWKRAGPNDIHLPCFFCGEDPEKRGRLYINTDPEADPPGLLFCHLCGKRGAYQTLRKHFGDPVERETDKVLGLQAHSTYEILQVATTYYHELLADNPDAYKYLRDGRGLTLETIQKHQLGYADGTLHNFLTRKHNYTEAEIQATGLVDQFGRDFLRSHITIPYQVFGSTVMIRGRTLGEASHGAKYMTPPGNKTRMYNVDALRDAKQACITEGEFDALVLEQLGYATIGIPGATQWQEGWNASFEDVKRIYVVFDNDSAGQVGGDKVALSLGPKAKIVKMPEGEPKNDPTEWIVNQGHSADDFQMLLIQSKGGHLLTVYDAYEEWKGVQSATGLKLGIPPFDDKLTPGLLPAQVMVYLAKTGVGKTIMMLNLFHRMIREQSEVRLLFVSLEQTRGEWFERARRIYRFYNPMHTDERALGFFRERLLIVDKNRLSEEDLVACIDQYEFEMGGVPDVVGIDYLGYWAWAYKGEPYERTSAAIMALKAIAGEKRVTIMAPHQVNRGGKFGEELEASDARDSGVVEETADFMFTLWSEDNRKGTRDDAKTGKLTMKMVKSRHGGSGTPAHFQFAPLSLAMVPVGEDDAYRAIQEYEWSQRGDSFEIATYRHATGNEALHVSPEELASWRDQLT